MWRSRHFSFSVLVLINPPVNIVFSSKEIYLCVCLFMFLSFNICRCSLFFYHPLICRYHSASTRSFAEISLLLRKLHIQKMLASKPSLLILHLLIAVIIQVAQKSIFFGSSCYLVLFCFYFGRFLVSFHNSLNLLKRQTFIRPYRLAL